MPDGKYCQLEYESYGRKVPTSVLRGDLVIQLSNEELRRWRDYRKRHNLTDQQELEDILGGVHEDFEKCPNCGRKFLARYNQVGDETPCPKCGLNLHEAVRKAIKLGKVKLNKFLHPNFTDTGTKPDQESTSLVLHTIREPVSIPSFKSKAKKVGRQPRSGRCSVSPKREESLEL